MKRYIWISCVFAAGMLCWLAIGTAARARPHGQTIKPSLLRFQELSNRLATLPIDDCDGIPTENEATARSVHKLEDQLFDAADDALLGELSQKKLPAAQVAKSVLGHLGEIGEKEGRELPAYERFRAKLLDLGTVLVVTYTFGSRATFSAFGVPETVLTSEGSRKNTNWTRIGTDGYRWKELSVRQQVSVFPLWGGPSRVPRFLSEFEEIACGDGQTVVHYDGYQWNASSVIGLQVVLHRRGVWSGELPGYPAIGKLSTSGPEITLPYCWHSAVDDSIWATLCSVDTYDLSGEQVRMVGTRTNRPDLLTVARAIQYAQHGDLRALAAYSGSVALARRMANQMPPETFFAAGVNVKKSGAGRETVEIMDGWDLKFNIAKRRGNWIVLDFQASRNE